MKRILYFIASVQFFVAVSVLLAIFATVASLVPQGLASSDYAGMLNPGVWTIVRILELHQFHASPLLFVLVGAMETSLLLCVVPRVFRRVRSSIARTKISLRVKAPDLIHLGLALTIAGGFLEFALRERWEYSGPATGVVSVDSGTIEIIDAGERFTEGGALAGWYIDVLAHTGDEADAGGQSTEVIVRFGSNDPEDTSLGRLHFRNFHQAAVAVFEDTSTKASGGRELVLTQGEGLVYSGGGGVVLVDSVDGSGVFAELQEFPRSQRGIREAVAEAPRLRLARGDRVGPLELIDASTTVTVAFSVTRSPGRIPILVGLLIMVAGMVLYLAKRFSKGD